MLRIVVLEVTALVIALVTVVVRTVFVVVVTVCVHIFTGPTKTSYLDPFTPKSDQFQISPAASPVLLPHSRKNLVFHSFSWKMIILPILTTSTSPIHFRKRTS